MEDNDNTDPKRHTSCTEYNLMPEEEFLIDNEGDEHLDPKTMKTRGHPPLGPKLIKLQQELQDALFLNNQSSIHIEALQCQLADSQDSIKNLSTPEDNTQITQRTPQQEKLEEQVEILKETIKRKKEQIEHLPDTTMKQGKRIINLLTQNQKLKQTNGNLIDRLAKGVLTKHQPAIHVGKKHLCYY
jgi:hypothetical protein